MVYVYITMILLMVAVVIIYKALKIKVIRVFGFELICILIVIFFVTLIMGEIVLPMPQYYIKHNSNAYSYGDNGKYSLNRILEEETLKSGIKFDQGSFKIIDSHGMNFVHLFLCSYQSNGKEVVRIFEFEKNIFGNMKPKYPLSKSYNIISKSANSDDYYQDYVRDGLFGGYLLTAGYAPGNTEAESYGLHTFTIDIHHPSNYFLWMELVDQPWKTFLAKFATISILSSIYYNRYKQKREPVKFYSRWRAGDKIVQCFWEEND